MNGLCEYLIHLIDVTNQISVIKNDLSNEFQDLLATHDIKLNKRITCILQKLNVTMTDLTQSIHDKYENIQTSTVDHFESILLPKMVNERSEKLICYQNTEQSIPISTLQKFPSSDIYIRLLDVNDRTDTNDIYFDCYVKHSSIINDYMNNKNEYVQELLQLSSDEQNQFIHMLLKLHIPIQISLFSIINNEKNQYGIGWKHRCVFNDFNNEYYNELVKRMNMNMNYGLLNFNEIKRLTEYRINNEDIDLLNDLHQFLKENKTNKEFIKSNYSINEIDICMKSLNINIENDMIQNYLSHYTSLLFYNSSIFDTNEYDKYINEFMGGNEYKWKLLYRASEYDYTASSFHKYCDNQGPTLVLIKNSEGYMFGGFITKSWSGDDVYKNDLKSFIFTLKNPHNVPPTKYSKLENSQYSIRCASKYGPIFCGTDCGFYDICIKDKCNVSNSCFIRNDGEHGYECDTEYKQSLFVNTNESDVRNRFSVFDYEVYSLNNYNDYVKNSYKCGELIYDYAETSIINTNLIPKEYCEDDLLKELCELKISLNSKSQDKIFKYYYTPSNVLLNSHIIDIQYDKYINKWIGNEYKWKLLYRASEHEYTSKSFHECCDNQGPTLILIKNSEGCKFGGFTSKSWSGDDELKGDSKSFIFTLKNPHNVPPTKYNKRKESKYAIGCYPDYGPVFYGGNRKGSDIYISNYCNISNSCLIDNDGTRGYECNTQYLNSLFVNTNEPNKRNYFSVLDYEVYTVDNYDDYLKNNYKCGELIYDYIKNKTINTDLIPKECSDDDYILKEFNDLEISLNSESEDILIKYYYTLSNVLLNSQIINSKYDKYINEWFGHEYKWKLLYRASEHEYTAKSFHECCDNNGPTLILIKNSEGCIFGGFTSVSWKNTTSNCNCSEIKGDSNAFLFTLKNFHNVPPTKYNKLQDHLLAIECYCGFGPIFHGSNISSRPNISVSDNCNQSDSCSIYIDRRNGYECDPIYGTSLFVNTNNSHCNNTFSVLDYEVYAIENYDDYLKNNINYQNGSLCVYYMQM